MIFNKFWPLVVGALLLFTVPAFARVVIFDNPGGSVVQYQMWYQALRASGDTVEVRGDCVSACTLMLGTLKPSQVCVTPGAHFGFHSAGQETPFNPYKYTEAAALVTREIVAGYPLAVRKLLRERFGWHGQEHPEVMYISATEIAAHLGYSVCRDLNVS